jgi:hypothetical protein
MLKKVSVEIREQGTKRPPRVQSGADLCGGLGSSVGIEGLGLLGLLVVGIPFDVLFFLLLLLFTYEFWIWVLGIPQVTRSLMSLIVGNGMLVISSLPHSTLQTFPKSCYSFATMS